MPWIRKFWQINGGWIEKVSGAVLTERAITVVGRAVVDVPMIWLFEKGQSVVTVFLLITPVYLAFALGVVALYDFCLRRGQDLLGIDYLRSLEKKDLKRNQTCERATRWVMRRRSTIFIFGTLFFLDSDIVTLLLRKENETFGRAAVRITLPSVIWGMIFWSAVYKLAVMGFKYARWLIG
jgi:hypothetical protein